MSPTASATTVDKLLMRLRRRDHVSAEEEEVLRAITEPPEVVPARRCIVREGEPIRRSMLIIDGMVGRYKDMRDGQRQITGLHISGDFADLHGFTLGHLDQDILAITDCRVSWVPHEALNRVSEQFPHLARMLWFLTNVDAAMHRAWAVSLGRRDAIERIAHLICEMHVRFGEVGMADERSYAFPVTQSDLAECLGLTPVHVNRVLKELREMGLMVFRSGRVTIENVERLRRLAEFTPDYLYLDPYAM